MINGGYFLPLLSQKIKKFLNGVFLWPKVSPEIVEITNSHWCLIGKDLLERSALPKLLTEFPEVCGIGGRNTLLQNLEQFLSFCVRKFLDGSDRCFKWWWVVGMVDGVVAVWWA